MQEAVNDQLVLIAGESGTGKSASLMNIRDQGKWLYLNCEAGKRLPFRSGFRTVTITDPYQVYEAFTATAPGGPMEGQFKGVIIDTITFLMEMFESVHVLGSKNTMEAWGHYAQFFKNLMQQYVAPSKLSVIMLGHTSSVLDEAAGMYRTTVPVKGSLKGNGIEAFFSTVVSTKKVQLRELEKFQNPMLTVTAQDEAVGFKHVFQTGITKTTIGERIRGPLGLWKPEETYVNNDAQALLDHLAGYYGLSQAA